MNDSKLAFPVVEDWMSTGMTLREYYAGQALAGVAADNEVGARNAARLAVEMADNLIEELNK